MSKLPPVMKKGCWMCGPKEFGSFEFKGETITIDTEEKYLYWNVERYPTLKTWDSVQLENIWTLFGRNNS